MNTLAQNETLHNPHKNHYPYHKLSHNELGYFGESLVAGLFKYAGYSVTDCSQDAFSGDLCVSLASSLKTAHIEVKTAREDKHGRFTLCLRKAGKTDCGYSDYVAALLIDKSNQWHLLIIPCHYLKTNTLRVSSNPNGYTGKYRQFRITGNDCFEIAMNIKALGIAQ